MSRSSSPSPGSFARCVLVASALVAVASLFLVAGADAQIPKKPLQTKSLPSSAVTKPPEPAARPILKPALIISKFKASPEGDKMFLDIMVTHNSILRGDSPNPANDGAPQPGSFSVQRWTGSEWDPDPVKTGQLYIKPNQNYSVRVEGKFAQKYRLRVVTNVTSKEEYKECTTPAQEFTIKFRRADWISYSSKFSEDNMPSEKELTAENELLQSLGFMTRFLKRRESTPQITQYFLYLEFKSPDQKAWMERSFGSLAEYAEFRKWLTDCQCEIAQDRLSTMSLPLKTGQAKPYSKQAPTAKVQASLNDRIRMHCESLLGKQVGSGDCWDLVSEALRFCKAKQPGQGGYGNTQFGKKIALKGVLPGDILTFQGVVVKSGGSTQKYPHHAAVVRKVNGKVIELLHQNANNIRRVQTGTINLDHLQPGGVFLAYRPQPR